MSEINQEFQNVAEQINAKLKEAADALREANKLAGKAGMEGLIFTNWTYESLSYGRDGLKGAELQNRCEELQAKCELINVRELESEMNEAGWSISSSYC